MSVVAEAYENFQYVYQATDGLQLINNLPLRKGSCVLDIGCGTGYLTSVLADRVGPEGTVTGVDPDKERLSIAERNYAVQENIRFLEGSSDSFPGGPYDIVFSNQVMHWVSDKEAAFRKIYNNMKIGGMFGLVCAVENTSNIWELMDSSIKRSLHVCTSDIYESTADRCGFKVVLSKVDNVTYTFENWDQYTKYAFASVNRDIEATNIDLEEVKKMCPTPSEEINMDWIRLTLILKK